MGKSIFDIIKRKTEEKNKIIDSAYQTINPDKKISDIYFDKLKKKINYKE